MSSIQSAIIYRHLEGEEGVFVPLNGACRPGGRENHKSVFNMAKKKVKEEKTKDEEAYRINRNAGTLLFLYLP